MLTAIKEYVSKFTKQPEKNIKQGGRAHVVT